MLGHWRRLLIIGLLSLIASPLGAQQFGELNARPYSTRNHFRAKQVSFEFLGTPANSATVGIFKNQGPTLYFPAVLQPTALGANQLGPVLFSIGTTCGTNPSSNSAYLLKVNGTTQCTITLSTSCAPTVSTCTTPWQLNTGQTLTLVAPGTVNGETNLGFSIPCYLP